MDATRFLGLLRTISVSPSRRGLLAGFVCGVSTYISSVSASTSAAQRKRKKKKKKSSGPDDPCVCDRCPANPCIPKCAGRVCGDDGCGGICGVDCLEHEVCQEGTCVCAPGTEICRRGDHFHCFAKCGAQQLRDQSTCLCCGTLGASCTPDRPGSCCGTWICQGMCADGVTSCRSDTDCGTDNSCGSGVCIA
jgi:hypothetical protein